MTRSASLSQHPQHSSGDCAVMSSVSGATFFGSVGFLGCAGLPEADVFPSRISNSLRFIARHMICVSKSPDAPTTPPTATSSGSSMAIPAIAPATPESELSSEIVIGISAPPTRIAKITPNVPDRAAQSRIITAFRIGTARTAGIASKMTVTSDRMSVTAVQIGCPFKTIGRWGRTLWSLPAATRLPVRVRDPTKIARPAVTSENAVS